MPHHDNVKNKVLICLPVVITHDHCSKLKYVLQLSFTLVPYVARAFMKVGIDEN